jgi:putative nucleotidyltransferase with HDIG domain
VLSEDQAIAAKVLRVANSSFFGTGRSVTQVSRAVMMLGVVGVRNLVLGIAARDSLAKVAMRDVDHAAIWRHSIAVGSACELIARLIGYRPPEEAFVAGLLHDIGQLAMMTIQPEGLEAVTREQGRGVRFLTLERAQYGVDHTEVGARILSRWQIPAPLREVAMRHHEPQPSGDTPHAKLLAIVMLSDTLAQLMGFGLDMPVGRLERAERASQVLGLDEASKIRIVDTLARRIDQAVELFASVDSATPRGESVASKRAVWIGTVDSEQRSISQLLLEHHGYDVVRVLPDSVEDVRSPVDLIIVALPDVEASTRLAWELVRRGQRNPVVLADPPDGGALRHRDQTTGICWIPRFFTAFDLHWATRQVVK